MVIYRASSALISVEFCLVFFLTMFQLAKLFTQFFFQMFQNELWHKKKFYNFNDVEFNSNLKKKQYNNEPINLYKKNELNIYRMN